MYKVKKPTRQQVLEMKACVHSVLLGLRDLFKGGVC